MREGVREGGGQTGKKGGGGGVFVLHAGNDEVYRLYPLVDAAASSSRLSDLGLIGIHICL